MGHPVSFFYERMTEPYLPNLFIEKIFERQTQGRGDTLKRFDPDFFSAIFQF